MNDHYVIVEGKKLRCGYTTGSCAAGAAKGAAKMLIEGKFINNIKIDTPAGIELDLKVENPCIGKDYASCCIVKDAGDDPDVTDKIEIYAKVSKRTDGEIKLHGGMGIGKITRTGFWGKAGESAINHVPRKMIIKEISSISDCGFDVEIYAPKGEEVAKRTFNKNIGIEGGISIIGTKGIVEPMSEDALKKSIYIEIDQIFERGSKEIILFLGNYGEEVVKTQNLTGDRVKISNFIGDMLLYCYNKGFSKITLVGHIGKLSKLSIGALNTHNKICDVRIEAFIYYLALEGAPIELINKVNSCKTSEEALKLIKENNYGYVASKMINGCVNKIKNYIKNEEFNIDVIMYSMDYGILGVEHD